MRREGIDAVGGRPEVLEAYDADTQAAMAGTVWVPGCNGYFTDETGRVVTQLPHTSGWYAQRTAAVDPDDSRSITRR